MATGHKANNGVVSLAIPGDGGERQTLLEYFRARGKRTGLVTTDSMTGATPAGFGAHDTSRNDFAQIAADYLTQTEPNVLFGGGAGGITPAGAAAAGYTVVTDRASMQALDASHTSYVSGQFGSSPLPYEYDGVGSLPHLTEMTSAALDIIGGSPEGFFLMVEGGNIDHAGHSSDLARDIFETIEFSSAVRTALDWAAGRTDTLIIVTADHETGGLTVTQNNGAGALPSVSWASGGNHTAANVPLYAWGSGASLFSGTLDNTAFFVKIADSYGVSGTVRAADGSAAAGAGVSLSGKISSAAVTDSAGQYSFTGLSTGTYTVTPAVAGWSFTPGSRETPLLSSDAGGWDFTQSGLTAVIPPGGGAMTFVYSGGKAQVVFPGGSFGNAVSVTLRKPSSFPAAGGADNAPTGVGAEIIKDTPLEPMTDAAIAIYYQDADMAGHDESRLFIARYDPASAAWVPLFSVPSPAENKVTAQTSHLSLFQVMESVPQPAPSALHIYPNPFYPAKGHTQVNFTGLPAQAVIRLYSISGELVRELTANTAGMAVWDGRNRAGKKAASGIYLGSVKSPVGKASFKLAVIR